MMKEMGWQVDEEVNRNKNGEADGMNLEVDSKQSSLKNMHYIEIASKSVLKECKLHQGGWSVTF